MPACCSRAPATPIDWGADDAKRVADLTATGERREGAQVILLTPAGALDDTAEVALVERLDKGVAALRAVVGRHDWQVVGEHELLATVSRPATRDPGQRDRIVAGRPLWLGEGLADYVAQAAALFTTERQQVAPTFYACGTSFTKHLVDRIGLAETIALMPHIVPNTVLARIEAVAKTSMEAIRAEWRRAIGVP